MEPRNRACIIEAYETRSLTDRDKHRSLRPNVNTIEILGQELPFGLRSQWILMVIVSIRTTI
jgi:hypothetical protein